MMMKKLLFVVMTIFGLGMQFWWAAEYHYFYAETCGHCVEVAKFFKENEVEKHFSIQKYEIFQNPQALTILKEFLEQLQIPISSIWTPFMVMENENKSLTAFARPSQIKEHFTALLQGKSEPQPTKKEKSWLEIQIDPAEHPWQFLGVMVPMAIADSINPCAFAVMLLLLSTIFSKSKSRKKTIWSGFLFAFAIFLSYFLMGIGLYKALGNAGSTSIFKWIIGGLGILIGLGNLKDFFWYGGGGFKMEVPMAWRPKMMKLIQSVVSPAGAFGIGILVSLFLLPCSSGPYLEILGLLKTSQMELNLLGIGYLLLYNLLFVLPMLIITFLVGTGQSSIEKLAKLKNKHTRWMHLGTGILMLLLGMYVIWSSL